MQQFLLDIILLGYFLITCVIVVVAIPAAKQQLQQLQQYQQYNNNNNTNEGCMVCRAYLRISKVAHLHTVANKLKSEL